MMSERNHVGPFKTAMNSRDGTQHYSKKQWAMVWVQDPKYPNRQSKGIKKATISRCNG